MAKTTYTYRVRADKYADGDTIYVPEARASYHDNLPPKFNNKDKGWVSIAEEMYERGYAYEKNARQRITEHKEREAEFHLHNTIVQTQYLPDEETND